jgi:hypothetical protein
VGRVLRVEVAHVLVREPLAHPGPLLHRFVTVDRDVRGFLSRDLGPPCDGKTAGWVGSPAHRQVSVSRTKQPDSFSDYFSQSIQPAASMPSVTAMGASSLGVALGTGAREVRSASHRAPVDRRDRAPGVGEGRGVLPFGEHRSAVAGSQWTQGATHRRCPARTPAHVVFAGPQPEPAGDRVGGDRTAAAATGSRRLPGTAHSCRQ